MQVKRLKFILPLVCLATHVAYAEQVGISTEISYMGDAVSNISGGLSQQSTYLGTGDLGITIDTEEAGMWQGGTWFIETLVNHGNNPSTFVGDVQGVSNIADGNRTRLQQLWYQHSLGESSTITAGLHDLNSEFYVSHHAQLFLNSSFGIGPEISVNVPTSLWPEAGFGVRLSIGVDHGYYHFEVYDGDPSTRTIDVGQEGLMWIAEAAHTVQASLYKVGIWQHTADKTAPDGVIYDSDYGVYMVWDYVVDDRWGAFLQLGLTPDARNDISDYIGLGFHIHGIIPNRQGDVFGVAVARAGFGSRNQRVNGLTSAETTLEITYDMAMNDFVHIHPSYQWVQYPSGDPLLAAAHVAMLRVEINL